MINIGRPFVGNNYYRLSRSDIFYKTDKCICFLKVLLAFLVVYGTEMRRRRVVLSSKRCFYDSAYALHLLKVLVGE